jgi:hypothetical protein
LVKGINNPRHRKGEGKMKNETKNEKANVGEAKPKFQQAEPAELDEAALLSVAGGRLPDTTNSVYNTYCGGCPKPNPY